MSAATMPASAVPAAETTGTSERERMCRRECVAGAVTISAATADDDHISCAVADAAVELRRAQTAVQHDPAAIAIMRLGRTARTEQESRGASRHQNQSMCRHG
jgi:hypothetical protein